MIHFATAKSLMPQLDIICLFFSCYFYCKYFIIFFYGKNLNIKSQYTYDH